MPLAASGSRAWAPASRNRQRALTPSRCRAQRQNIQERSNGQFRDRRPRQANQLPGGVAFDPRSVAAEEVAFVLRHGAEPADGGVIVVCAGVDNGVVLMMMRQIAVV